MKNQHTIKKADGHNGPDESTGPVSEVNRRLQQSAGGTLRTSKKGPAVLSARSLILSFTLMCGLASTTAFAGPIILGGDDLDYHGNYNNGSGPNQKGWLYIQKALASMYGAGCITRPGNDGSIAVLGCPSSTNANGTSVGGGEAGAAIHFAGNLPPLSKVVNYYDGATGINNFFTALTASTPTVNPAIIYIPSGHALNGIDAAEGLALTTHAPDLKNFVNSGGGLMAHISTTSTSGWVTTVVTGVMVNLSGLCTSTGATLTTAGNAAFPALSNSDIDATAGPCHATFSGVLGGLSPLALDGENPKQNLIIGGGCGTTIGITPTPTPTPTPKPTPTPTPPGSCEFSATTACQGTATEFTDLTPGATSWNWNFGDGTTSTQQNPTHLYANPGTYTVTLSTPLGGVICTVTHTVTVTACQLPSITGPDSTCSKTATYCITKAPNVSYVWNVTNGTMTGPVTTGNQICITVTWNSTGNGLITVKATDGKTCCSLTAQLLVRACDDYCCKDIKGAADLKVAPKSLGGELYTLTPTLSAAVKVIRVTATVISTSQTVSTAFCGTSGPVNSYVRPPLSSITGFTSSLPVTDPREVDWNSSSSTGVNISAGVPFPFNIQLPPQNLYVDGNPCPDIIKICVKYAFTDEGCRTCEIIRCFELPRAGGVPK